MTVNYKPTQGTIAEDWDPRLTINQSAYEAVRLGNGYYPGYETLPIESQVIYELTRLVATNVKRLFPNGGMPPWYYGESPAKVNFLAKQAEHQFGPTTQNLTISRFR